MEFESFLRFNADYKKLLRLYNGLVFSFQITNEKIQDIIYGENDDYDLQESIYNGKPDEKNLVASNMYSLKVNYKKTYLRQLHELLLIRLISMLEVFLIDSIKEIFTQRKDLFLTQKNIEISYSELFHSTNISILWGKIISKDCRDLHSRGFNEISKYYNSKFNIDLSLLTNYKNIKKAHDIRHLIVHRMGKTDVKYRHSYNDSSRVIRLEDIDFTCFRNDIESFVNSIHTQLIQLVSIDKTSDTISCISVTLIIKILKYEECKTLISENFSFFNDDQLVLLKDILRNKVRKESVYELTLVGDKKILRKYYSYIRKACKTGLLEITSYNTNKHVEKKI